MDDIDHGVEDPFLWDVGAVSNNLCSFGRSWARDPVALAQKIVEEEIDGRTLLTYEHTFSRKELMTCLGVKTAGRMAALAEEIIGWQSRSKGFRAWKRNHLKKLAQHDQLDDEPQDRAAHRGMLSNTPDGIDQVQFAASAISHGHVSGDGPMKDQTAEEPPTPAESDSALAFIEPLGEEGNGSGEVQVLDQNDQSSLLNGEVSFAIPSSQRQSDHQDDQNRDERPLKRRRIEPISLSLQPLADHTAAAPGFRIPDPSRKAASENNPDAYLGSNALNALVVKSHVGPADPHMIELPNDSFATAASIHLPPGQRIWVASLMRSLFQKNGRRESLFNQGFAPPTHSTEDEESLDLSDIDEEWDEQTKREIEEEKADDAARERELASCLSQERVEAILHEALDKMKILWEEKKLPRYQKKAYGLWMDAARRGRTLKIINAQQDANRCEARIQNMIAEIRKDKWQREQEVQDQARILEQNVDEKLYSTWLVSLLQSREQPEKPVKVSRPRESKPRPSLLDDEVLTSDDEMDNFVVHDDDDDDDDNADQPDQAMVEAVADLEETQPHTPVDQEVDEDIILFDLTQLDTPKKSSNSRTIAEYIDLTTPQKTEVATPKKASGQLSASASEIFGSKPLIDQLENVESIAETSPSNWAKQQDRWRLVISMLFRLRHARRQAIFGLLHDNSAEDAWNASIQLQLSEPITDIAKLEDAEAGRLLAFDMTRIFYSFLRCSSQRNAQIAALEARPKNRLETSKVLFSPFCSFLREMAPHFPQDSQIVGAGAFDDIEVDGLPDEEGPSKGHRRAVREVVQNKDALDMRERETRRIEEQEARRIKLRAEMAKSTAISSDKSRLIINESKQDDQAFIYVNDDIGNKIKDHQIKGVRFIWNQLIRDADVRQGCLLAHTMGLGKTMQVITFLVAIVQAAVSEDTSVRMQIPDDMRKSQTLVLCPTGLVDNWEDEVLTWAPKGLLGRIRKVEASMVPPERIKEVRDWAREGGLLIMGYEMFKRTCEAPESGVEQLLFDKPRIVVADEAHTFKNPTTKVHQACAKFRTRSRIALTGTPLSNNVEEYYSMIDWVAPNYLGPLKEFRQIYAIPIEQGLDLDSGPAEKREALKMMEVLKRTVAPKVDRATISCMEKDLPSKHEFVLFIAPTPLQTKLYNMFIEGMQHSEAGNAKILSILSDLTLICNHPRCYRAVAQEDQKNSQDMSKSVVTELNRRIILKETNAQDLDDAGLSQKVTLLMLILDEACKNKEKTLVFSQSIPTLNYLENLFRMQKRRVSRLDGTTKISTRQESIKSFNQGDKEVYLISTRAGGVGLNIQGANRVVIFDLKWNPVHIQQAIGRAYRIGQKKTVFVYHFLLAGSFEEVLHNKSVFKTQLASRAVDKKFPISWGQRNGTLGPITMKPPSDLSPYLNRDPILDKLIKYKSNGEGIRQIVPTDTFEEEDANSKVTPEMNAMVEEFVKMEHMRRHDPENYERLLIQKQMADLAPRLHVPTYVPHQGAHGRPPETAHRQSSFSNIHQSMDGASDDRHGPAQMPRAGVASSPQVATSSQHIPVPPLIVGANTYFRETGSVPSTMPSTTSSAVPSPRPPVVPSPKPSAAPSPQPSVVPSTKPAAAPSPRPSVVPSPRPPVIPSLKPSAAPSPMTPTAPSSMSPTFPSGAGIPGLGSPFEPREAGPMPILKKSGIFGTPQSYARELFEKKISGMLQKIQGTSMALLAQELGNTAESITTTISNALKEQAQGFLHDNARWGLLIKYLDNDRFFSAVISGMLRLQVVAMAKTEELERRVTLLNELTDQQVMDQYKRKCAPDPHNLGNIGKPTGSSVHAIEDLKAMRIAADKRKKRAIHLPAWANEALAQNGGEGSGKEVANNDSTLAPFTTTQIGGSERRGSHDRVLGS